MIPNYKDYHTNDGIHNAMREYANSISKSTLIAIVSFPDGSEMIEEFFRAKVDIKYKTPDNGIYYQEIDGSKFAAPWFSNKDLSTKEIKEEFTTWVKNVNPDTSFIIKWKKGV